MNDFALTLDAVRGAADDAGLSEQADALVHLCLPAARIVPRYPDGANSLNEVRAVSPAPVGSTKIGGSPDLPLGHEWPRGEWGPMTFCMQVRVEELGALAGEVGVPGSHVLSFFADRDPLNSNAEAGAMLAFDGSNLERQLPPEDWHEDFEDEDYFVYTEAQADILLGHSLPNFQLAQQRLGISRDWDVWERLLTALDRAEGRDPDQYALDGTSQILGHPGGEDMIVEAAANLMGSQQVKAERDDWRLLAEFSSEVRL